MRGALLSKYRNAGQTCVCANRILVQDGIHEAFATRLAQAVSGLAVGDGFDLQTQVGPLINAAALDKVNFQRARNSIVYPASPGIEQTLF